MALFDFLTGIFKPAADIVDSLHTSAEEKMTLQLKMMEVQTGVTMKVLDYEQQLLDSRKSIIVAEAQSESWLAKSWRPITMLTFTGLIVARWCGIVAPNLSEQEYLKLWDIVEFGLGGYVVGRSVEKLAPSVIEAIKKK